MSDSKDKADEQARAERSAKVESKTVYSGKSLSVRVDDITLDNGHTYQREIVERVDAAVMVALDPEGKIVLTRQWRRPSGQILVEIPAGKVDKGEKPEETARRELQEEVGYAPGKVTSLGGYFASPGYSTEYQHLFLCEQLHKSQLKPDENEKIEVLHVTFEESLAMIERGEIKDSKSISGLLRYNLYLQKQK